MTADTLGGVWIYALELIAALRAHSINVALATFGGPLRRHQWEAACRLPNLQLYESRYRLEWMQDPWSDIEKAGQWLFCLEEELAPALVHFNQFCFASLAWRIPKLIVAHSDVLTWWQAVRPGALDREWNRYRDEVRSGLHAAQVVVAPSHALLQELQVAYGPFPHARVIPNGRSLERPDSPIVKKPFILGLGRIWDEAKNLQLLDQIAPALPWPVIIAGSAAHPDGGTATVRNARFLGELSPAETGEWIRSAAIYCLPAKYEPFGLSILEAALSGCALVLGAIPSLLENWTGAAVFVDPANPTGLTAALRQLIEDENSRAALAARASERGLSFGPARMGDSYARVYSQLLASH